MTPPVTLPIDAIECYSHVVSHLLILVRSHRYQGAPHRIRRLTVPEQENQRVVEKGTAASVIPGKTSNQPQHYFRRSRAQERDGSNCREPDLVLWVIQQCH